MGQGCVSNYKTIVLKLKLAASLHSEKIYRLRDFKLIFGVHEDLRQDYKIIMCVGFVLHTIM